MPNDPILHLLGLARKAGKLEMGEEPVGAVCRARHARLVLLASDTAPNTRRRAAHFCENGSILFLELPYTKAELGFVLGRGSCAMLALTDAGFAASLVEKLAARNPDRYAPAAQQLRQKADRMLQRQREKRQHEKNLREGKRKPWAAPPAQKKERPAAPPTHNEKRPAKPKAVSREERPKRPGFSSRPGRPGPGGRRLSGKFRPKS